MSVAALVVSYNRSAMLRRCLEALCAQTHPLDKILVVDNNSTDGSVEMMRREFSSVEVLETGRNLGASGGYALGVDTLISRGYDLAFLMDDDAEARPDALQPLVAAMEAADYRPGFVASQVLSFEGAAIPTHVPLRIPAEENHNLPTPADTYPAAHSTFVGVLINLRIARRTYLPIADFYLWWDDSEYTSRLQVVAGGLASTKSVVLHEYTDWRDLGPRLGYDLRNRMWIIKSRRLASHWGRVRARKHYWRGILQQAKRSRRKSRFLWQTSRGLVEGLVRRPRPVLPTAYHEPFTGVVHETTERR